MARIEIETPTGPAWADLDLARKSPGLLMIGHGAGGTVDAPDLLAVRDSLFAAGVSVARITQPYRVAGRKAPAPIARLDEAWLAVASALQNRRGLRGLPIVHAGRSSGARVACRCAGSARAAAVVALAFPVHPPGKPEKSRVDELSGVIVPVLVVQGSRDAFGQPPAELFDGVRRQLTSIAGADHSLKKNPAAVADAVTAFVLNILA
ncbi:MAG: alpha/beta hydrolase [Pseudonocardiales bacterium]|nr:alpha/beta hydrolase [Pseudonocardiales bacterium]